MIPVLVTIMSIFASADSARPLEIGQFPDAKKCGDTLEYIIHDAVCHTLIETTAPEFSPRPKRNLIYEN
ncbi:hypothetical protein [Aquamicrobium zhengzhouense]|uniref:Uncharacterized protein n=1 Tax=Aquamicrobium zhengzhouense TaxID=2781738 RepID=A0ABS0SB88_9HYPH|nr:hypothetical protein [Aquamicrobium zhengzhouense]MBI1620049.1 hypothetical protein [Aquamicrobium zhengzhouense]